MLDGNDTPLNFDGTDYSEYSFNDKASVEGTVLYNTALSFEATAPDGYEVIGVEAEINGESIIVNESDGKYSLSNNAPDSGTTVVNVKYGIRQTPFTLNYKYYSREWNADDSNYEGKPVKKVLGFSSTTLPQSMTSIRIASG